ncbi:MAG: bifunctional tetrahydrofolate synthase/dihydrofolate synthase [Betaproteobacteria bacterium]
MSRPATVEAWLAYLETLHPKSIAMGLDRVRAVLANLDASITVPVVTVAGTNGKGSTCAMLESILRCAGYSVGLYTSPHLLRYHERVHILGREATDGELLAAFAAVECARLATPGRDGAPTPLTYFEFGTLAALWLFARAKLDVLVLEVGLGGRLDAVNVIDASVAVLSSVGIDHTDYLGHTREDIGREKAGIFRAGRPAVCADRQPPASVTAYAEEIGARLLRIGRDYGFVNEGTQWRYWGPGKGDEKRVDKYGEGRDGNGPGERFGLPFPALRGAYQLQNAATVLAVLDLLREALPVRSGALREGLLTVELPGRFQVLPGRPTIVLDVAHNPHAAAVLADELGAMAFHPATFAVFSMYADKDIAGVVATMRSRIDRWFVAALPGPRGAPVDTLRQLLAGAGVDGSTIRIFPDIAGAFAAARETAGETDRIVAFGSFLTVAAVLAARAATGH